MTYTAPAHDSLASAIGNHLAVVISIAVTVLVAVALRWLVVRLVERVVRSVTETSTARRVARARAGGAGKESAELAADRTAARARTLGALLKSAATLVIAGTALVIIASRLGFNVGPVVASAGIVGIAVGFGAQSLIKDFLTGIFMIFEDQYGVGDLVDTGQATGTVQDVRLRVTKLRDDNGVIWYVPNGSITRVGNKSQGWAEADVKVPVAAAEDQDRVETVLREAAQVLAGDPQWADDILDEAPVVSVEAVTPDTAMMRVRLHTRATKQGAVTRELRVKVMEGLDDAGIAHSRPAR